MNIKFMSAFAFLGLSLTLSAKEYCAEKFYTHVAFNDTPELNTKIAPTLAKKIEGTFVERVEQTSAAMDKLNEVGINQYIELALQGSVPDSLFIWGSETSLMDLAIMHEADNNSKDKLLASNYFMSPLAASILIEAGDPKEALETIKKYSNIDLNELKVANSKSTMTVSNYWLLDNKASAIVLASEMGLLSIPDNFYKRDLIDLQNVPLEQMALLDDRFDVEFYQSSYSKQLAKKTERKALKDLFRSHYADYTLALLCVDDFQNVAQDDVLFSVGIKELEAELSLHSLNINDDIDVLLEKIKAPMLQQYLVSKKEHKKYEKAGFEKVQDFTNNNQVIEINPRGYTKTELDYINNDVLVDRFTFKFRPEKLALLFIEKDSPEVRKKLLKNASLIKNGSYNGMNTSHFVALYYKEKEQFEWFIRNFGDPVSDMGLSLSDSLLLRAFYFEDIINKYDYLNTKGLLPLPDRQILQTFINHAPDSGVYDQFIDRINKEIQ